MRRIEQVRRQLQSSEATLKMLETQVDPQDRSATNDAIASVLRRKILEFEKDKAREDIRVQKNVLKKFQGK